MDRSVVGVPGLFKGNSNLSCSCASFGIGCTASTTVQTAGHVGNQHALHEVSLCFLHGALCFLFCGYMGGAPCMVHSSMRLFLGAFEALWRQVAMTVLQALEGREVTHYHPSLHHMLLWLLAQLLVVA
jgi:hypothetical protein